jgi:tetratricopeptide (TPR) repeat protein
MILGATGSTSPSDQSERLLARSEAPERAKVSKRASADEFARSRGRIRRALGMVGYGVFVFSLAGLAIWQSTRSHPIRQALAAERAGDAMTALRRAMDYLETAPGNAEAALIAARSLTMLRFPDRAEPYYEQARRAGLLHLDDLQARALALTESNRLDMAVKAYEEILKDHPDEPVALRRLATVFYSQMRLREALALAERLADVPGQGALAYTLIGSIQHEQKHPERAADAYERALSVDPDLHSVALPPEIFWTNFAQDLIASGRPARARQILEQALAGRENAVQMDLLGLAYQSEGAFDDAERCFRSAAEWDARLFSAWLHLGRLMMQPERNQPESAISCLQRAAELAPSSFEPPYSLGLVYRRLGRNDEADRYQKQSEQLRNLSGPTASEMGAMPEPGP